jgi:hypothetical protein
MEPDLFEDFYGGRESPVRPRYSLRWQLSISATAATCSTKRQLYWGIDNKHLAWTPLGPRLNLRCLSKCAQRSVNLRLITVSRRSKLWVQHRVPTSRRAPTLQDRLSHILSPWSFRSSPRSRSASTRWAVSSYRQGPPRTKIWCRTSSARRPTVSYSSPLASMTLRTKVLSHCCSAPTSVVSLSFPE